MFIIIITLEMLYNFETSFNQSFSRLAGKEKEIRVF